MNKKRLIHILTAEAVIGLAISIIGATASASYSLFYFPLAPLVSILRKLSLAGSLGNVVAIALYVAVSLAPIAFMIHIHKKRELYPEDYLFAVLSAVLFAGIYAIINPITSEENPLLLMPEMSIMLYSALMYSILLGYVAFRLLRKFFTLKTNELHRYFGYMLVALAVYSMAKIVTQLSGTVQLFQAAFSQSSFLYHDSLSTMSSSTDNVVQYFGNKIFTDALYIIGRLILYSLPDAVNIYLVLLGFDLLEQIQINRFDEKVSLLLHKISRRSAQAVAWLIGVNISFNLFQAVFANYLRQSHISAHFPVLPILFVLAILLFSRYMEEARKLKEDNDLFV